MVSPGMPLVLVNLLFASIALAVGFAAGAWVFGGGGTESDADSDDDAPEQAKQRQIDLEHTAMVTDRLRDLAAGVASDVGEHNANIGKIEADLAAARENDYEAGVLRALAEISQANEALQNKLSKAEQQIEAQAEEIRVHESDARTDSLTQLANRRAFDDEVKRRFAELQRHGAPFSLVIMDVDHFKKFNDTHGHQAGDEVLRRVGKTLTECAREMDLPCRYGGEEFAVVLPKTLGADGTTLVERVRKAIESMSVRFEGKDLKVTMSLGIAQATSDEDPAMLIKRADEALYEAKSAGRNRAYIEMDNHCVPITEVLGEHSTKSSKHDEQEPTVILDSLPKRTRFLEQLRTAVRIAHNDSAPLALLTAELSGQDRLVEEYGPTIARLTLDSVAQFLDNSIRKIDVLGRLDEKRFVVLMPGQSAQEAREVGDRLGKALSDCTVPLGEEDFHLNTTMSVIELSDDDTAVSFIKRAELQMTTEALANPATVMA